MLGVTGAEVVVVLPFTFVTSLIIKLDPTYLIQTSNSCVLRFKNPRPSYFFSQTGIDLRIHQLSYLISSRSFWEILKLVENIESNILGDLNCDMKPNTLLNSVKRFNMLN